MRFSQRVQSLPPYLFAGIERQIAERRAAGVDVISSASVIPTADAPHMSPRSRRAPPTQLHTSTPAIR